MPNTTPKKPKSAAKHSEWNDMIEDRHEKRKSDVDWGDIGSKMVNYDNIRESYDKKMKSRAEKAVKYTKSPLGKVLKDKDRGTLADPISSSNTNNPNKIFRRRKASEWSKEIQTERIKEINSIIDSIGKDVNREVQDDLADEDMEDYENLDDWYDEDIEL